MDKLCSHRHISNKGWVSQCFCLFFFFFMTDPLSSITATFERIRWDSRRSREPTPVPQHQLLWWEIPVRPSCGWGGAKEMLRAMEITLGSEGEQFMLETEGNFQRAYNWLLRRPRGEYKNSGFSEGVGVACQRWGTGWVGCLDKRNCWTDVAAFLYIRSSGHSHPFRIHIEMLRAVGLCMWNFLPVCFYFGGDLWFPLECWLRPPILRVWVMVYLLHISQMT